MNRTPVATKVSESPNKTVWTVKWPSRPNVGGKSYIATTYPNSQIIFLETAAKRRPVSKLVATKIFPQVRAAIEAAQ